MRTCIIQTNNAPDSLIRFTEIGCLFNYKNDWLDFFQNIIITTNADEIKTPGWKINAGQYITTSIRSKYKNNNNVDLRRSELPLLFERQHWNIKKEMKYYRGKKQEYIFWKNFPIIYSILRDYSFNNLFSTLLYTSLPRNTAPKLDTYWWYPLSECSIFVYHSHCCNADIRKCWLY